MLKLKKPLKLLAIAVAVTALAGCQQVPDAGFADEKSRCVVDILNKPETPATAHGSLKKAIEKVCGVKVLESSDSKGRACAKVDMAGQERMVCSDDGE